MNKEEYKKRIKQEFEKRGLKGFANHTILADLMADICTDVVKEKCNLPVVSNNEVAVKCRCCHEEIKDDGCCGDCYEDALALY